MNDLRFAMIGCGKLGRTHLQCISTIEGARFTTCVDVAKEAAQSAADEFGCDTATTEAQDVFDDDAIDAVYICTRHDSHAPLAIAAAKAGKHILIEKPLALKLDDCNAIADAVREHGVYLMPAFKMRYYPLIIEARKFIENPQVIVGQMMDSRWPDDIWPQDPVFGGANVNSQGCHMTDILRYLAGGEPQSVWAAGGAMTHPGHPCIDQCVATLRFDNGCAVSWIQGDAGAANYTSKFYISLFGDNRSVQLHDRLKKATFTDGGKSWTVERDDEEGFQLENEAFVAALRENRQPDLTAADGIQATRMVLLAEQAIRTGDVQMFNA